MLGSYPHPDMHHISATVVVSGNVHRHVSCRSEDMEYVLRLVVMNRHQQHTEHRCARRQQFAV